MVNLKGRTDYRIHRSIRHAWLEERQGIGVDEMGTIKRGYYRHERSVCLYMGQFFTIKKNYIAHGVGITDQRRGCGGPLGGNEFNAGPNFRVVRDSGRAVSAHLENPDPPGVSDTYANYDGFRFRVARVAQEERNCGLCRGLECFIPNGCSCGTRDVHKLVHDEKEKKGYICMYLKARDICGTGN